MRKEIKRFMKEFIIIILSPLWIPITIIITTLQIAYAAYEMLMEE